MAQWKIASSFKVDFNLLSITVKTLFKLIKNLIKPVLYRRYSLVLLERDLAVPERSLRKSSRWTIRQLTDADLNSCEVHFPHQMKAFAQLFLKGFVSFGSIEHDSGNVISIVWYAQNAYQDEFNRYTFDVQDGEVFQFAGEVATTFRNTQVSAATLIYCWRHWQEQGKTKITCAVDSKNSASLKLLFHMNWQESGKLVRYHRWLGKQITWLESYADSRFDQFKRKRKTRLQNPA